MYINSQTIRNVQIQRVPVYHPHLAYVETIPELTVHVATSSTDGHQIKLLSIPAINVSAVFTYMFDGDSGKVSVVYYDHSATPQVIYEAIIKDVNFEVSGIYAGATHQFSCRLSHAVEFIVEPKIDFAALGFV